MKLRLPGIFAGLAIAFLLWAGWESKFRAMTAQVGQPAPEFRLQDQDENWVSLKDLTAKSAVMIAFYPGDFTPVCTKQLCSYQDAYERFVKYDLQIVGISGNSPEEHQKFRSRYHFAFPLLTDPGRKVTKEWGVTSFLMFGGISRAVFIVGKGGKILYRHVEATSITHRKPGELLGIIDKLKSQGAI